MAPPHRGDDKVSIKDNVVGLMAPPHRGDDTLVDGHNRYKICSKHNKPFSIVQKNFSNRYAAMLWILKNQLSRRNLNDFQRVEMVRKCEDAVKAPAEKRMPAGKSNPSVKLRKGRATNELGDMAGVSGSTYEHATEIIDKAPENIVNAVRKEGLSINAGYKLLKCSRNSNIKFFILPLK